MAAGSFPAGGKLAAPACPDNHGRRRSVAAAAWGRSSGSEDGRQPERDAGEDHQQQDAQDVNENEGQDAGEQVADGSALVEFEGEG
jgi:hypothetical protein